MKSAKPLKPVPTVSRIGQHGKRPMAKQIREKKDLKKTSLESVGSFKKAIAFFRRHFVFTFIFVFICFAIYVALYTPAFKIKSVEVTLDEQTGCLSKQYVEQYMLTHYSMMWSQFFFSDEDLLNMHPCLEKMQVKWNPFNPGVLQATVIARKPVLKVTTQVIDGSGYKDTAAFFSAPVISEDLRYMLTDGRLVQLDAEPQVPHVIVRYLSTTQLDAIHFDKETIVALLQVREFLLKEYNYDPQIITSDTGIIQVNAPFARSVFISLRGDIARQLGSLQAILRTSTIDRSKLDSIDVRSGNAVVKYTR